MKTHFFLFVSYSIDFSFTFCCNMSNLNFPLIDDCPILVFYMDFTSTSAKLECTVFLFNNSSAINFFFLAAGTDFYLFGDCPILFFVSLLQMVNGDALSLFSNYSIVFSFSFCCNYWSLNFSSTAVQYSIFFLFHFGDCWIKAHLIFLFTDYSSVIFFLSSVKAQN